MGRSRWAIATVIGLPGFHRSSRPEAPRRLQMARRVADPVLPGSPAAGDGESEPIVGFQARPPGAGDGKPGRPIVEMYGVAKESVNVAGTAAPAVSNAPAQTDDSTIHVQVHKKNGQGTVDVILKKRDNGYLGPQGEFYSEMPSPSQLTEIYGDE